MPAMRLWLVPLLALLALSTAATAERGELLYINA